MCNSRTLQHYNNTRIAHACASQDKGVLRGPSHATTDPQSWSKGEGSTILSSNPQIFRRYHYLTGQSFPRTSSQRSNCSPQPPRQQYRPILDVFKSNFPPPGCRRCRASSKRLATSNEGGSHGVSSEIRPRVAASMTALGECNGLALTWPSGAGFSACGE